MHGERLVARPAANRVPAAETGRCWSVRARVHSPIRTVVLTGILGGAFWLAAECLSIPPDWRAVARRTALLAGATGLVGGHLLRLLLADDAYQKVTILARRGLPRTNPK